MTVLHSHDIPGNAGIERHGAPAAVMATAWRNPTDFVLFVSFVVR
jgi:hypothetical protein